MALLKFQRENAELFAMQITERSEYRVIVYKRSQSNHKRRERGQYEVFGTTRFIDAPKSEAIKVHISNADNEITAEAIKSAVLEYVKNLIAARPHKDSSKY